MALENASKAPLQASSSSSAHLGVPATSVVMGATAKAAVAPTSTKEPLSPVAPPLQIEAVKEKDKGDGFIKKKIYIEKHAIPKGQEGQYVNVKLKFKDGHWFVKQSSRKIKI